jgi:uncharacterized membrane protein
MGNIAGCLRASRSLPALPNRIDSVGEVTMNAIAHVIQQFTSFLLTQAVCVGCVTVAMVGLVVVALVVEACDTIPDRRKKPATGAKSEKPRLLLF